MRHGALLMVLFLGACFDHEADDGGARDAALDGEGSVPKKVCDGTMFLETAADVAAIVDCTTLTGQLFATPASEITALSLPALESVEGAVELSSRAATRRCSFRACSPLEG